VALDDRERGVEVFFRRERKQGFRKAADVSDVGHHGNGDYAMDISDASEIEYLMSLVRQSYDRQKI